MAAQHQIAQQYLLKAIASGRFPEGEYLPRVEQIAAQTRCSPYAVRRAFRRLHDRGILQSVKKAGTRVLRRPAIGRAVLMRGVDAHANFLLQDAMEQALVGADCEVEFLPFLYHNGRGFDRLRQLAKQHAQDTVLVTIAQEAVPAEMRAEWEAFAGQFRGRVGFQFEDTRRLPRSVTLLPDPVVGARLVVEHLLALGHRRIGVVAGEHRGEDSTAERRAIALDGLVTAAGGVCERYYYNPDAGRGVPAFVKRTGCTAWWAINDFQALEHIYLFQQAGYRVPQDLAVVGANDTPWATSSVLPLTSLSLNTSQIAAVLAEAVEAALTSRTDKAVSRKMQIPPLLMARASTLGSAAGSPLGDVS